MPKMPFSDAGGGIALWLHNFGQRDLVCMQTDCVTRKKNPGNRNASVVATGQQTRPRHRTDRGRIKAREFSSFGSHQIKMRRFLFGRPKRSNVTVAKIIDKDQHNIWRS